MIKLRPRVSDLVLLGLLLALLGAIALSARPTRAPDTDARAQALAGELRCPVCQGLSISDSPAPLAEQMRRIVRVLLAGGATDDEVRGYFVARYGDWILLAPPFAGRDLVLWLAPGLFILVGLLAVTWRARRRGRSMPGRVTRLGRLPTLGVGLAVIAGLGVPLALAVGMRSSGQQITGFFPGAPPSIDELESRVAAQPSDGLAVLDLADAYLDAGRFSEAVPLFRRVLERDPTNVEALDGLGVILVLADRPDAAILAFDKALAVAPDDADALIYRALARSRIEGPGSPAVRADAERFLTIASDDPRAAMARQLLIPTGSARP